MRREVAFHAVLGMLFSRFWIPSGSPDSATLMRFYLVAPLQNPPNPHPERRLVDSSSPESPRN
jgi:hypothetical protein